MAVDREFYVYIGSAGPGPGGRTDGRTVTDGGRTALEDVCKIFTDSRSVCKNYIIKIDKQQQSL